MGNRIIVFAKAPVPGRVKTRLIPALGPDGAADLAARMLRDTWAAAAAVAGAVVEVCTDPAPGDGAWTGRLPEGSKVADQGEGDLGARLARAAARAIGDGDRVLLIGTDCPGLTERRLREACRDLETHDAVIHPTFDGGYALLGLTRFDASIFADIAWSGESVARATIGRIGALGWRLHLGETLHDIDRPDDLAALPLPRPGPAG
jgi:uncharacterized protein